MRREPLASPAESALAESLHRRAGTSESFRFSPSSKSGYSAELRAALGRVPRALVLFGHLHVRRRSGLRTATGEVDVVCATGAALDHPSDAVRAGYNVYEFDRDGAIVSVEACVLDEPGRPLRRIALARG